MARPKKQEPTPDPSSTKATGTLAALEAVCHDSIDKYGLSKTTTSTYGGYIGNTRTFLKDLIEERKRLRVKDHIPNAELAHALDKVPNRYSSYVLQLFIGQKCCTGEKRCGKSTAEGIYSAWAKEWSKSGYGGDYHCDPKTGKVIGCPARAYEVKQLVKSVKARAAQRGEATERHHAEAITIEDMRAIMDWSEAICSDSALEAPLLCNPDAVKIMDMHGLYRAFSTSAFTMFTRNFETCNIRFGDLDFTGKGPAPKYNPYIGVELSERKGWQKAAGNDGVTDSMHHNNGDQTYEIYEQPNHREIDMYTHLPRWLNYLSLRLGRPLQREDYVFPYIAPNGVVHPNTPISYDTVQNLLQEFASGAGLKKTLTTHCFRRGGAQYRFMYAPVAERWSLNAIQWWGGWAVGEGVDVLLRYLVNSLHNVENSYRSALDPDRGALGDKRVLLGSDRPCDPVSQEDILDLKACLTETMERLAITITQNRPSLLSGQTLPLHSDQGPLDTHPAALPNVSRSTPVQPPSTLVDYTPPYTPSSGTARRRVPAIPGVFIPNLPAGSGAWREAIQQWEGGGPDGMLPLRDWPPAWYTGDMRTTFGAKRGDRKTVAEEFYRLKRDEDEFLRLYPEANKGFRALLSAIQMRSPTHASRRRVSKRGRPEERDSRASSIEPGA
ncbi:hypothetical protein D9611_011257 [Ephemerocybe angulata]|uniref:Uncharacterized protein n=1 Tax=Ephemerocybe angulata TaxID=980116 RepID=A0A8H5F1D4_9AGAR|nr:hypothetical protein D9611_011257 [Tulosesus angulatus]